MSSAQRESYSLPSQGGGSSSGMREAYQPSFGTGAFGGGVTDLTGSGGPVVQYVCGECAAKVQLSRSDAIRCKECGHRVLYKERTKRMVQFEAR